MTTTSKAILAFAVVGAIAGLVAFFGLSPFGKAIIQQYGSPAGTTLGTAKFAGVTMNLATVGVNATTSSIYNSSANDYYVTSLKIGCEGVGTSKGPGNLGFSALTLTVATTSTSVPAAFNPLAGSTFNAGAVSIPTSTVQFASSTPVISAQSAAVVWPSLTYMTFGFNATNTAACTVGVDYFSS